MSLKSQILDYLGQQSGWVNGGEIERFAIRCGNKASNGSRRARELANADKIDHKVENKSVWYRSRQSEIVRKFEGNCPFCQFEAKNGHSFECPKYENKEVTLWDALKS